VHDRRDALAPFRFDMALSGLTSKTVAAFSAVITGANGMNSERDKRLLRRSWVSRRDGLARIKRAPKARGPYSMRPT